MTFSHLYSSGLDRELGTNDSTRLFTTGRRQDAINEGLQQFAVLTRCFTRRIAVTLEHGQQEVNLGSTSVVPDGDFLELAPAPIEYRYTDTNGTLTVLAGDELPHRTETWLARNEPGYQLSSGTSTGVQQFPRVTYLRRGQGQMLGLWPPPGRASTNDSMAMRLWYVGLPPTLTSDTQVPFTASTLGASVAEPYHYASVHYAAAQLEKLRRDYEASRYQMEQFLGYVTEYRQQHERLGGQTVQLGRSYFAEARAARTGIDEPIGIPWGNLS